MHKLSSFFICSDTRVQGRTEYPVSLILMIVFFGTLCDSTSWYELEDYARNHAEEIRKLHLKIFEKEVGKMPSHDTLNRVFQLLDPKEMERLYLEFIHFLMGEKKTEQICIDGKSQRGVKKLDFDASSHVVTAFDPTHLYCLAQDFTGKKENEITSIKRLLEILDLEGVLVTIDAMGTQKEIAQKIADKGGDYLFTAKANQKFTMQEIADTFRPFHAKHITFMSTQELGHGRLETRTMESIIDPLTLEEYITLKEWPMVKSIHKLTRTRENKKTGDKSSETVYLFSSLEDPERVFTAIRKHWAIENNLHYMLDVYLKEDDMIKRAKNATMNMNICLKQALTTLLYVQRNKDNRSIKRLQKSFASKNVQQIINTICF